MLAESQGKIASTEIVLPIRQREIYVYANIPETAGNTVYYSNSGTVEGAIGSALGTAIAEAIVQSQNNSTRANAEAAAKPLRAALVGFDFDETLQGDLRSAFSHLPWLNAVGYRVLKEFTPGQSLGAPTASGRFLITADYHLTEKADELIVSLSPTYYFQERSGSLAASQPADQAASGPNPAQLSWTDHLFYTNRLFFRVRTPNASSDQKDNVCEWASGGATALRAALRQGSAKLAQMLVADMLDADAGAATVPTSEPVMVDNIKGVVLTKDEEGSLVKLESGARVFLAQAPAGSNPPCRLQPKASRSKRN